MIAAIILAATGAATGPANFANSPFVETSHSHEWILLDVEDSGRIWWDQNSVQSRAIEGHNFPTILARVLPNDGHWMEELFQYQDIVLAIDCENAQIAELDEVRNGQPVVDPWADLRENPSFTPLPGKDKEEIQTMMRAVCGEGWTR